MSNMKYDDTDYLINREESIEYKISDTNVSSIEKDIKRCEELIKPEHANWIGISNQLAIVHLIERIKELEEALLKVKDKNTTLFITCRNSIPKQKAKEIIYTIIDYKIPRATNNGYYYDYFIKQEYKNDFVKLFNKLLEDK